MTDCTGVIELGAATLTSIPASDIAVSSLVFNTVGTSLTDTTSNFCAVLDGAGNVWAIDRDLPTGSPFTTANSSSRIIPCIASDIFSPVNGCYEGVIDDDVTAYRWSPDHRFVQFTDDPNDSPASAVAPLGGGFMSGTNCVSTSGASVSGLVCNVTSGEPVADYVCDFTPTPNSSSEGIWLNPSADL